MWHKDWPHQIYVGQWPIFYEGERGGSVVEYRTPEREVRGSRPTAAVLCPWARHFTPRKYWLITQEAMAPSRHDWKIVDWDVKPQHNQPIFYGPVIVHFHRLKLFLYIKKWCRPGVFVPLRTLALVLNVGEHHLFHSPVIFALYLDYLMDIINVGQLGSYFMIQWFYPVHVSWRLFDGWTSSYGIMSQCDSKIDFILSRGHSDLYFTFQWFCLWSQAILLSFIFSLKNILALLARRNSGELCCPVTGLISSES